MSTIVNAATTFRGSTKRAWVECEITPGIGIHVIGLPDAAVKEVLLRVATAMQASGYMIPGKKCVINVRRERDTNSRVDGNAAGWLDFPMALAMLIESGQVVADTDELKSVIFVGELGLDGKVKSADGGFLHPSDTALAVSWKYRDERAVWGWDTLGKGGDTWLDLTDLKDAVELLEAHSEEGCRI